MIRTAAILLFLGLADSLVVANGTPVLVMLRETSVVHGRLATLADIADVKGGDAITRQRISRLDIAVSGHAPVTRVTKSQMVLRLRLAGFSTTQFELSGAPAIEIAWNGPSEFGGVEPQLPNGDARIVEMAKSSLAELWKVALDDVEVRLTRPLPGQVRRLLEEDERVVLRPFLSRSALPGTLSFSFGAYRNETLLLRSAATVQVRLHRQVAVAARDISIREVITATDVRFERQATEGRTASQAVVDVVGSAATHSIRKGAVLLAGDVRKVTATNSFQRPVIKRGDLVHLVASGKGLRVSVRNCEALENGREGETIRIRNPNSKKTVAGRVVRAGEVEIRL